MFKASVIATAAVGLSSAAQYTPARSGKRIQGRYIVRLHNNANRSMLMAHVEQLQGLLGRDMEQLFVYKNLADHSFVGYSASLTSNALRVLMARDDIFSIEEDQVVELDACNAESNPDWGLARTNYRDYNYANTTYTYNYADGTSGAGVDAYIIDTGIYCENNDFTSKKVGTCTFGYSTVKGGIFGTGEIDTTDGNGHGTHCAGTVAGQTYGIAKEANLIAVKVLSDSGSGSTSGVIGGIDWVTGQVAANKKPSVANMSLGGGFSQAQNDAVAAAVNANVVMVVAAGNDDKNACDYSPASEPSAVTVGATDKKNARASYSNWGSCVDIFGPGSEITSAWIGSPSATKTISGTSMASPHVCGVAAKYKSANTALSVAQIAQQLISNATPNVISDVKTSPNLMVYGTC